VFLQQNSREISEKEISENSEIQLDIPFYGP
jgi:hypothetical protein